MNRRKMAAGSEALSFRVIYHCSPVDTLEVTKNKENKTQKK